MILIGNKHDLRSAVLEEGLIRELLGAPEERKVETDKWMNTHIPGFAKLSPEERGAIVEFSLLWAFFEAQVFNGRANAGAIESAVKKAAAATPLDIAPFMSSLDYFRNRYITEGDVNHRFEALNFRANDRRQRAEAVLRGGDGGAAEIIIALLIIVLRLRNNLFHGEKWAYGIGGQRDNFVQAGHVLMSAMDMFSERNVLAQN